MAITLGARPAEFAKAERKPLGPQLMLETGGHMAIIWAVAFTPDGKQLVSASEDKTIRVWDLATAKTVRTIRGEIANGLPGKIYAMALSPDSKWLATGGWLAGPGREESTAVRLYDFASGRLVALLKGHEDAVVGLAFSPDGRHLISGSFDRTAIIWDVETRPPFRPGRLEHRLRGHGDHIYAVGFTPDSKRAVTGSNDHELRLWRVADGSQIARMTGHGNMVRSLAVAPDGAIISGDWSGEIRLWDGVTGAARKVLALQGTSVGSLSASPDGKWLLSGNGAAVGPWPMHVYDLASGKETATYSGHDNVVGATAISPDGRWAATCGGNGFPIHLWDPANGKHRLGPDGQGRPVWAVAFSVDGTRIGWGDKNANPEGTNPFNDRGPLQYDLALPSAADALPRPRPIGSTEISGFRRAVGNSGEWSLEHRKGGNYGFNAILDIQHNGKTVGLIERGSNDGSGHTSYSFTPDGQTIISGGGNGTLTAYDRQGNKLPNGDFIGHNGDVWAIAPSPDGRYLVSGSADQTLRLWNLKTRELLVTLFYGADGEWVMWTPQGYYDASGPGADMIGWQINHGPDKEAEYVTAAQLRKLLNRPDIVARAIQLASAEAAVEEAYGTNFKLADLLARPVRVSASSRPPPMSTSTAAGPMWRSRSRQRWTR